MSAALVVVVTWILPATSSLWLDELGTWWVVQGGLGEAIDRAYTYHGQSPAYYVVAWLTKGVVGQNEFLLRVPSLVAAAAALYLLFRLVRRLVDSEAAWFAVLGSVGLSAYAFAASDFRPYAFAVLCAVGATALLVRWLDGDGGWFGAGYVLVAALTIWFHYLFALVLLAHLAYALVRLRGRSTAVRPSSLVLAAVALMLLVVPLAWQLASLWSRRASLSIPGSVTEEGIIGLFLPPVLLGGLVFGVLTFRLTQGRVTLAPAGSRQGAAVLLWSWLIIPTVVLLSASLVSSVQFLAPRYHLMTAPAAAALFGWAASSIRPEGARRIVAVVFAIVAVFAAEGRLKASEDWGGAAAFERSIADQDTLVLMHPALVESQELEWFDDPERASYLLSPDAFYPFDGRLVPMPYVLDDAAAGYLDRVVVPEVWNEDRFLLVTRAPLVPYTQRLEGLLAPQGWSATELYQIGTIQIVEFTRDAAP